MATTAYQISKDAASERDSRLESGRIAAEIARQAKGERYFDGPTTAEVCAHWVFTPNLWHCQATADGRQTQLSMMVQDPKDTTSTFYVTYDFEADAGEEWQCYCPSFRQHWYAPIIRAVQDRVTRGPFSTIN